jgi:hypothetical protein
MAEEQRDRCLGYINAALAVLENGWRLGHCDRGCLYDSEARAGK